MTHNTHTATTRPSPLLRPGGLLPAPTPTPTLPTRRAIAASASSSATTDNNTNLYTGPPRVCILGGGFGGLYTAVKLEALLWPRGGSAGGGASSSSSSPLKPRVTLIDKGDRFVFKPLLYELLNGGATAEEVAPTFAQLLAPYDVRFVRARVAAVEEEEQEAAGASSPAAAPASPWRAGEPRRAAGRVVLDSGESVEYDYLVVALGAEADARGVPGVRERAVPFVSLDDALRVKATLEQRVLQNQTQQSTVVVVGAGYSGVELATVLAERVRAETGAAAASPSSQQQQQQQQQQLCPPPRVQLVTPGADILEGSPVGQREAARRALSSLGVEVLTGVRVTRLGPAEEGEEEGEGEASGSASASTARPLAPCTVHYEASSASSSPSSSSWKQRADLVVWTAGSAPVSSPAASSSSPSSLQRALPFPTTPRGTVATEPSLRVVGHPRAFALGDTATATADGASVGARPPVGDPDDPARRGAAAAAAAATPSPPPLPATAQVAFQQADYAAWNVWASITGRPLLPFRYQHLGSMMALGSAQAAVALPVELPSGVAARVKQSPLGPLLALAGVRVGDGAEQDDGKAGVTIEGPLAQLLRRGAYLYRQPTGEQRLAVAAAWLTQAAAAVASASSASSPSSSSSRGR
jgi:NADH:ubiquinone reductase (non-electrogenic)